MKTLGILLLIAFYHFSGYAQQSDSIMDNELVHFTPIWSGNPYLAMNFYVSSATLNGIGLIAGDEIGIFDGEYCVGAATLTGPIDPLNPVSIIASTDDPNTTFKDGFTAGNSISYRLWQSAANKEILDCNADYVIGDGNFISQGTALLSLSGFIEFQLTSLKALIEAFYNGNNMTPDSVTIQLRENMPPYNLVEETQLYLDTLGNGSGSFSSVENGIPYYIVVKHRNAVETWSSNSQTFLSYELTFDFTDAPDKAYGNNLKNINGKWCIYGGDINQDGLVDITDINLVFTDNVNGMIGYVQTDLNGDMFVEVEDLNIVFINNVLGIERKRPPGIQ